ncbi:MAG TPA: HAMP domain-containing sensor histidine kinase [Candidatus Aquilonibacter sp.]
MNLRRRIVLTIASLLAASCALFSIVSLTALDRTLASSADLQLLTLARAVGQIVDYHRGKLSVDPGDIRQIAQLHGPAQHISVVDADGRLIFGERVPARAQRDGLRLVRSSSLYGNAKGMVATWQSDAPIAAIHRTLLVTFLAAAAALVGAGALFSRLLADRILDPIDAIAQLAARIEARDLSLRIGAAGSDELARLCATFDRMLDRLQASFETERRFVADASHELRTPLAVIRAETDLALRRPRTAEAYREAFASVDREVARLERLVDDLLDTVRDRAVGRNEHVDVAHVIDQMSERMRATARGVHVEIVGDSAVVRGHRESIERAASAVLHNAITHGGGGRIDVRVQRDGHVVRIDIADDGPGFGDEALAHATERFWRADSARSRGGTGLGLSIARVLIEAHGGEVRLANAPQRGAIVSLVLPAG